MDSYLFLTPLLMLIVIGLLGFVGCDIVFGLDRVDPVEEPPTGLVAVPGDGKVTLSWDPYEGATRFSVKRGTMSGVHTQTVSDDTLTSTTLVDDDVENETTYYYVVRAIVNSATSEPSVEAQATPSASAVTSLVVTHTDGPPRNDFTGWIGMAFVVGPAPITARRLGRWALAGSSGTHVLKLVDGASKLDIAGGQTVVSLNPATPEQFVYGDLGAPIILEANTTYYLMSQEIAFTDPFYDVTGTSVTVTNAVTRVFAVFAVGSAYTEATIDDFIYGPLDLQYV